MAKTFTKLTRPAIRKLARGKSIQEHGIIFERLHTGDGLFLVNIMVDGQRIHRSIGKESDGVTRTTAEDFVSKARQDAREGRLRLPKKRKVPLSFKKAAEQYLDRLEEEGGKDIKAKRYRLTHHVAPFFKDHPLSQISTFDIERYKKKRLSQDVQSPRNLEEGEEASKTTPATVNRELAALSHLFTKAVEWDWIDRRPANIKKLKEGSGRIIYLTAEQCMKLLESAKADQNIQIYPFILIGLRTAMRKSEILSIKRENIDLETKTIYVPIAKAGARTQPMTQELVDFLRIYLADLPKGTPWLFPSVAAASGHTTDVRKAFVRSVERAGLDPVQVVRHTLRHTAITHLVQAGVDLPTVKRISGHKTLAMVERYSHQSGEHIAAAMDKLDARFKDATETA
ncbi:MAG: site-specific integrase [Rhodospirillaceae bacterium]